jgi:hypothetical protein
MRPKNSIEEREGEGREEGMKGRRAESKTIFLNLIDNDSHID